MVVLFPMSYFFRVHGYTEIIRQYIGIYISSVVTFVTVPTTSLRGCHVFSCSLKWRGGGGRLCRKDYLFWSCRLDEIFLCIFATSIAKLPDYRTSNPTKLLPIKAPCNWTPVRNNTNVEMVNDLHQNYNPSYSFVRQGLLYQNKNLKISSK